MIAGVSLGYWFENFHFVIAMVSFFAFFTTGWISLDSWFAIRRSGVLFLRAIGFFLLALWASLNGVLAAGGAGTPVIAVLLLGIFFVAVSFFLERLPGRPAETSGVEKHAFVLPTVFVWSHFFAPFLGLVTAARVWGQATVFLERGRKPLSLAFLLLSVSWLLSSVQGVPAAVSGSLSLLAEPYGTFWAVTHLFQLAGSLLLLRWTWGFIRFRLLPQLYLTVAGAVLVIFVVTTVVFTMVLLRHTQSQTLGALNTNVRTFAFAVEELRSQMTLTVGVLAGRQGLAEAAAVNDPVTAAAALGNPVKDFRVAAVTVLTAGGEILMTLGTDRRLGDSMSDDPFALRAFRGEVVSAIHVERGPEFPVVVVRAAAPLVRDGAAVGAVVADFPVDTAFVDHVQRLTRLDVVLYAGRELAATTLRDDDGRPRAAARVEDERLARAALEEGAAFQGASFLGREPFLVAGLPLTNVDRERVGILVVGLPQTAVREILDRAVRATFGVSALLVGLALIPLYGVARVLSRHQSA